MKEKIKDTDYFSLYVLSDGVYAAIAKPGQGAWSNAGIVDLGENLLVFDSLATPSAGYELRKQAEELTEELTGKKVKYLINSHYHGDHVFGNQAFADTTIISTSLTRKWFEEKNKIVDLQTEIKETEDYLSKLGKQIVITADRVMKASLTNQYKEMSVILKDLPTIKLVLPTVLFEEKMVIEGSKRTVELHCFGGGHTTSDTFLYLPEEKMGFMGDLVTVDLHVPIYDPEQFGAILEKVKQLDIETVVPGHGYPGGSELVCTLKKYLAFLIEKTKEAVKNGVPFEVFASNLEIPDEYVEWKGVNGIRGNLSKAYAFYERKNVMK
ncbi:MBL fold metallo-hydrolase [Rossellomorea aquimaris]|uniref:Glyoxylase-like metal-dependent hydrolase (Beta-lactamase superfamily II) n=1 Tax=Rossellomorea aquimaris TaxID=189382 RepID=A0A366E7M3_9BACI|nr:MBL fold metallo-hydrolase [Rossellomorea aquimaris]RBO98373.1 glyoxylase-like metal-dependent hydrolase (beta-lactamase superfamily II) [Rossellomorea aquimaris]